MQRSGKTFRTKNDQLACLIERGSESEVIAYGAFPGLEHIYVFESFAPNRGAAAPTEILLWVSQQRGYRCVPCRCQSAGEQLRSGCGAWEYPSVCGCGASPDVLQRSNEFCEPAAWEANVGIGENDDFEFFGQRLDRTA